VSTSKHFVPISRKVAEIILISLVVGLGAVILYFASSLTTTIERSTEEGLKEQSQILYTAVENFMLPGQAPLAEQYFDEIESQNPLSSVALFRADGSQAFSDNSTIREVNAFLGGEPFDPREQNTENPEYREDPQFEKATGKPPLTTLFRETTPQGETFFRIYKPLINKPKCTVCHDADHTIRGVIEVRNNITASVAQRRNTILISASIFLAAILILSLILNRFLHLSILKPIKTVRDVCNAVTEGDFTRKVDFEKNDEIGELGTTVNGMVEGLQERYELSKYVSGSTLNSLRKSDRGKSQELTVLFSDIRGFTTYSETHGAEKVVASLNAILNRQSEIIIENGGDIDKYVGDEIVAIFSSEEGTAAACRTAVTIQRELGQNSEEYDGLSVGIGINYGKVILGMIGSQQRADFTIIGDNVNVASRLCSAAKAGEIVISDSTYRRLASQFGGSFSFAGPFKARIKGKDGYVRVYKLLKEETE
jgi:adenylate cyclase